MERDNVREAYSLLETHLARTERLNALLVSQSMMQKAQTKLGRERLSLVVEIVLNYAGVLILGSFAFEHRADAAVAVSAAILGAALIAINAALVAIAFSLRHLDYEEPVLAVQSGLERIKMRRARLTAAILACSGLLWTPVSIILLSLAGVDVRGLPAAYVAANVVFGVLAAVGAWILIRHIGSRPGGSRWISRAADVLTGNAYREASEFLDTIERFREVA